MIVLSLCNTLSKGNKFCHPFWFLQGGLLLNAQFTNKSNQTQMGDRES